MVIFYIEDSCIIVQDGFLIFFIIMKVIYYVTILKTLSQSFSQTYSGYSNLCLITQRTSEVIDNIRCI